MINSSKTGFTLIETLIAIAILVSAVTGAYAAAQSGISSAIFSKNQVIAFYLAQEGIEQIRNMRDQNGLNSLNWLTGIAANSGDPCYFGNNCYVDALNNTTTRCVGACPALRQDTVTGKYGYDGSWPVSGFTRSVLLTQIATDGSGPSEVSVVVTVSWSKGLVSRQFKAQENITKWQ